MSNMAKQKAPIKSVIKTLPKDLGTIQKIIALHKKRYEKTEIVAAGFNRNTVYRQVREYQVAHAR